MTHADCAMCPHTFCEAASRCERSRLSGRQSAERQVWSTFAPQKGTGCFGYEPAIDFASYTSDRVFDGPRPAPHLADRMKRGDGR